MGKKHNCSNAPANPFYRLQQAEQEEKSQLHSVHLFSDRYENDTKILPEETVPFTAVPVTFLVPPFGGRTTAERRLHSRRTKVGEPPKDGTRSKPEDTASIASHPKKADLLYAAHPNKGREYFSHRSACSFPTFISNLKQV